jgi:hypothetical protein
MRRERLYRAWIVCACIASIGSGLMLWAAGERAFGALGIASGLVHALWGWGVPALVCGRLRRRPIVIPQLRPMVVSPPPRSLLHRLRTWARRRG